MNISKFVRKVKDGVGLFIPLARDNKFDIDSAEPIKRKYRLHNPIQPNTADIVNWVLYDRITFATPGTLPALFRLFVSPIGGASQVAGVLKTKVDTNLEQVSRLPDPQWFNTTGVAIYFNVNAAPVDIENFIATTYIEFWVSQKVYLEGPPQCFPSAAGLYANNALALTPAATAFVTNTVNGWPNAQNIYDVRLPAGLNLGINDQGQMVTADGLIGITILQGQSFTVQFKADGGPMTLALAAATPIPGVGLTISAYLHGILSRGVQ
jgi:hypothetical protein